MMKRRLIAGVMALLMVSAFPVTASAAVKPDNDISPQWEYMNSIYIDIGFNGTDGSASVTIDRIYQVTTLLEATITLYKQNGDDWEYVDSNSDSSARMLVVSLDFTAESGATYKAVAEVTAHSASGSESDTVSKIRTND